MGILLMNKLRLYNILFPMWAFWIFPTGALLIILPANFLIDSMVLYFAMRRFQVENGHEVWKHSILKVWLIGFFGDVIGAVLSMTLYLLISESGLQWDTFHFPGASFLALPGVILAGTLIYFLDRRFAFSSCGLDEKTRRRLSCALAVFTAPYAMLIPLYG